MRQIVIVAGLVACQGDRVTDSTSQPTADTAAEAAVVDAACELTKNALRAVCTVSIDPPQGVRLSYAPEDGSLPARELESLQLAAEHTLQLALMKQDTPYGVAVSAAETPAQVAFEGSFTTGTAPLGAQTILVEIEGKSSVPMVGMSSSCVEGGHAVISSTEGDLLWYEGLSDGELSFLEAVHFTEEQTVLAIVDGGIREVDLFGNVLLDVTPGVLGRRLHHDLFRAPDGMTWVLYNRLLALEDSAFLLDGFLAIDPGGNVVGDWFMGDHHVPEIKGKGGIRPSDYSHANAIWVDEAGDVFLSLRHQSAVLKVAGMGKDFGQIRWTLAGHASSDMASDFVLENLTTGFGDFSQQHNVHQLPDGRFAMFDNRLAVAEPSRVAIVTVDEAAGIARIEEAYDIEQHCSFQGSAWHTPQGNPMAGCAPGRRVTEFEAGAQGKDGKADPVVWTARADCDHGAHQYVPRFYPLDW